MSSLSNSKSRDENSAAQDHKFTGRGPTCLVCGYSRLGHETNPPRGRFDRWYFTKGPGANTEEAPDGR